MSEQPVVREEPAAPDPFAAALSIANAVLYEGYLLYPYTASSRKNRLRWQFGVVVPRSYGSRTGETAQQRVEILLEGEGDARIDVRLRFLHVEARRVEEGAGERFEPVASLALEDRTYLTFDEGVEEELDIAWHPAREPERSVPLAIEASTTTELLHDAAGTLRGRVVRERWPLRGSVTLGAEPAGLGLTKLRVVVENDSEVVPGEARDAVLRTAFVSSHLLIRCESGRLLSSVDPPESAAEASATLDSKHVWPVVVGEKAGDEHGATLVLASPIILYDFPEVAAKIEGEAFDATEIDELLQLSVLSLSDAERAEARATDPRARAIVERAERFGREQLSDLHGGDLRRLKPGQLPSGEDPFASLDVPALDCVFVEGIKVSKGSSVRLQPKRRADVWDTFLRGKVATVVAIHQDVEDNFYVAVTCDDDPASELHEWYGRSFFFYPEEIEPLSGRPAAPGQAHAQ